MSMFESRSPKVGLLNQKGSICIYQILPNLSTETIGDVTLPSTNKEMIPPLMQSIITHSPTGSPVEPHVIVWFL